MENEIEVEQIEIGLSSDSDTMLKKWNVSLWITVSFVNLHPFDR